MSLEIVVGSDGFEIPSIECGHFGTCKMKKTGKSNHNRVVSCGGPFDVSLSQK